ncbi:MAG: sensor histidine kinase [Nocardioides sp.]|uniref:sensor histidine kinase n=1 Tax=Nocardioides sp. TaxID=35761 RepID=UPI0026310AA4|nr:PAS domain-containing sensor histidine kinase [Nocardioides sp.]MCW2833783.1 sensor histidine kinase [Nocardioides sp.]
MRTPRPHFDAARLIDQVVDYAIIALDGSGTIESWNSGAERLKGYSADEAIGRSFSMFYSEEDRRAGLPLALLEEARLKGRVESRGWRVRKDGTRFWGDVVITALHDDFGMVSGFAKVTRDLTGEHELQESLAHSEERFRFLVSQVKDYAIIALDLSGTIESWNAGAHSLKGYSADEAIGRSFSMFYSETDRRAGLPLRLLDEARTAGSVEHTGWRIRKDGSRFWGDVVITALHDDIGQLTGFAKVTRDLTERKELEEAQASFLGTLAHDFRGPITAVKGFAELLRDAPQDKREDFLQHIETNADRLLKMMMDLVNYSTAHGVGATNRTETFDLAALARETVATMPVDLDLPRVAVPQGQTLVTANKSALERVLVNLVSNALKYSDNGPVAVDVVRAGDLIRLSVSDQGRGVAADDLDRIFNEFERGAMATEDGGTGLGLSSVKRLVEGQGGSVYITSLVGQGTTVTVELPQTSGFASF